MKRMSPCDLPARARRARIAPSICRALGRLLAGFSAVALAGIPGCQGGAEKAAGRKLAVAVSIVPQAWLVRQIGGEHVDVITLVSPGQSHEAYQPSDVQVSRLMQAAAYFRIGVSAESGPWFDAIRHSQTLRIVDTRDGLPLLEMAGHSHHPGHAHEHEEESRADPFAGKDPHVWLTPRLLKAQARTVALTLAELDPAHRTEYLRNLAGLGERLDQLDARIRATLKPVQGRAFLIYHPAWGYFAHDYGLRQIALETDGKEPTDEELTRLQQLARKEGIKVVFVQPQIAGQSAIAMAGAIGGQARPLDPLAEDLPANLLRVAEEIARSYDK